MTSETKREWMYDYSGDWRALVDADDREKCMTEEYANALEACAELLRNERHVDSFEAEAQWHSEVSEAIARLDALR